MPTVNVNAGGFGIIQSNTLPVWFDTRNEIIAGGAFDFTTSPANIPNAIYVNYAPGRSGPFYQIIRSYFYWDLTSYAGNITAIDMNIALTGAGTPLTIQPAQSVLAFGGIPPSIPLDVDQFDINTPTPPAPPSYGPTFNNGGPATVTLNVQALVDANTNGFLIVQLDEFDFDYSDFDPAPFGFQTYSAGINFTAAGNYLSVTYNLPGYGNAVNGVGTGAFGTIDTVNAVASADIDKVLGI